MSDQDYESKGSSFWQLMLAIPGTIIAFTLVIALIANYFGVKTDSELAQTDKLAKVEATSEDDEDDEDDEDIDDEDAALEAEIEAEMAAEEEDDDFEDDEDFEDESMAVAAAAGPAKSGEEVYNGVCMMCHATGMMQSPKFGDASAWEPRIAQGYDTLLEHAIKGYNMMPAKGGNPGLSDEEVASAVKHMANSAGADF